MQEELFEGICEEIRGIEESADPIATTIQLRDFEHLLKETIQNKKDLCDLFAHFNDIALDDSEFAVKLVYVFNTRIMLNFEVEKLKIREILLNTLQKNFENASKYKAENIDKFYNSITLLGECYNKMRLSSGIPIMILGVSLINVLKSEVDEVLNSNDSVISEKLANLVLTQVVLNGGLAKAKHKPELEQLMFSVRKCLIEIKNLSINSKSFLLMAIDLYYNNFLNLGGELEAYYGNFLMDYEKKIEVAKPKTIVNLEKNLREKLKIKPAEVKFERPALAIDRKVEELVHQKENLVPEILNNSPERLKRESPKKLSPLKSSPNSEEEENYSKPKEVPQSLKIQTEEPKSTSPKLNSPNNPLAGNPISKKNIAKVPPAPQSPTKSSSSSSCSSTKSSKSSTKSQDKPVKEKKADKTPPKATNKSPSQSPKTQETEKSSKTTLKKSKSKELTEKPPKEKGPDKKLEKSPQSKTESDNSKRPDEKNKNKITNSVPESSDDVTKGSNTATPTDTSNGENSLGSSDDANILKQQNSCRETTTGSPVKGKFKGKVYFREENAENLTWDNPNEDEMPETPPKLNAYSSSFLSFLAK